MTTTNNRIILPKVLGFRLNGFYPVFREDVTMLLYDGPNVILGGNGLGKTTLMQAVVYGLAGGLDNENLEENRAQRWGNGYFRGRLDPSQRSTAYIEVDFALGNVKMSVRRGFRGSGVIGFRLNNEQWLQNPSEASNVFARSLERHGGYKNADDFAFLVHRLLYLPESRRLIAWDTDAQVRILMLLNQDTNMIENDFRKRRGRLKELDSNKRRVHWTLGNAEKQLAKLMEYSEEDTSNDFEEEQEHEQNQEEVANNDVQLSVLVENLQQIARSRASLQRDAQAVADDLSSVSREIEELRAQIEHSEAALVVSFLQEEEREKDLALHKLVENGICPVCGTRQPELRATAQRHAALHLCMLCGSDEPHETNPELTTLRSRLTERIRSQQAFEEQYRQFSARLERLRREEEQIQGNINRARLAQPIITLAERSLPDMTTVDLRQLKQKLETQEAELEAQTIILRSDLEQEFEQFRASVDMRLERLRQAYEQYASEFLGLKCELAEDEQGGLVTLARFIPKFNGSVRDTPESCSEAQRFFLDIAFRMALIDMAALNGPGTFICETPENALDMSYVDNVARMFSDFTKRGHTLVLSANIQPGGIAGKLLGLVPREERSSRVLNLLEIGQLSNVHIDALPRLRVAADTIIGAQAP